MHEYQCVDCGNGTDTTICELCLKEFREQATEIERLRKENTALTESLRRWEEAAEAAEGGEDESSGV